MKVWSKIVLLVSLVASIGIPNRALATPACLCTLTWESSPDPGVAGYALYYSVAGSSVTNRVDVGMATTVTFNNLAPSSTYYFYVVAYDTDQLESVPSNLLPYTASVMSLLQLSPVANGAMNVSFHVGPGVSCHVEYTDTLNPPAWTPMPSSVADSNGLVTVNDVAVPGGSRFYRAVIP